MSAPARVFGSPGEAAAEFRPSAIMIGIFDGVHLGHQALIRRLVDQSRQLGVAPSVVTFDPHPAAVVAPARAPRLLSTTGQRVEWMSQLGIEQVLVMPFTPEVSRLSPEQFVAEVVTGAAKARLVVVGENFRFGNQQAGGTETLAGLGRRYGFETQIVTGVTCRGRMVSSTAVRRLIEAGEPGWAHRLLGRCYALRGEVVRGHGIGSTQTVPTLNLRPGPQVLPRPGVYITSTQDLDSARSWPSVTNVGFRPTFGGDGLSIETFLLSPLTGESPTSIEVSFWRWVREERKFADAAALRARILTDVGRAEAYFRRLARWRPAAGLI